MTKGYIENDLSGKISYFADKKRLLLDASDVVELSDIIKDHFIEVVDRAENNYDGDYDVFSYINDLIEDA